MTPLESTMAETLRNLRDNGDITDDGAIDVICTTAERLAPLDCFHADVMLEAVFGITALLEHTNQKAHEAGSRLAKDHLANLFASDPAKVRKPYDRTCPSCKAAPGAPCRNMGGQPMRGYHADRISGVKP